MRRRDATCLRVAVAARDHRQVVRGRKVSLGLLDLAVALPLPPLGPAVLEPHLRGGGGDTSVRSGCVVIQLKPDNSR